MPAKNKGIVPSNKVIQNFLENNFSKYLKKADKFIDENFDSEDKSKRKDAQLLFLKLLDKFVADKRDKEDNVIDPELARRLSGMVKINGANTKYNITPYDLGITDIPVIDTTTGKFTTEVEDAEIINDIKRQNEDR